MTDITPVDGDHREPARETFEAAADQGSAAPEPSQHEPHPLDLAQHDPAQQQGTQEPPPSAEATGSEDDPDPESTRPAAPIEQVPGIIEALLFVADGPVAPASIAKVIGIAPREIEGPLEALAESLRVRGLRLQRGPEGIQLVTAPFASSYIEQFLGLESAKRLSTAALETLAIIAYRQPVTRGQVEAIRGVNSDAAIDTLRNRGLVDILGRADAPGRPAIFGTTQRFLEHFGLERPEDLPPLPEEVAGVAAARFRDHGAQLPLPPVEEPATSPVHPALHQPFHPPAHLPGEHAPEPTEPHEPQGPQLPPGEPEQRRPVVEPGSRLPSSGPSLPRTLPGTPPRMPGAGPPRGGPPGSGGPPRFG